MLGIMFVAIMAGELHGLPHSQEDCAAFTKLAVSDTSKPDGNVYHVQRTDEPHYKASSDVCYDLVHVVMAGGGEEAQASMLLSTDHDQIGGLQIVNGNLVSCYVQAKTCSSQIEYDALIAPFMKEN